MNNLTDTKIVNYKKDKNKASLKVSKDDIFRPFNGETVEITMSGYDEAEKCFNIIDLVNLSFNSHAITKHLSIWMQYWECITFEIPQIPSFFRFQRYKRSNGLPYRL